MLSNRRLRGMRAVKAGMERQRVVSITPQRSDAVMMNPNQCVIDRVSQQRMRINFHKRPILSTGRGHNITKPHRLAHIGHPILGVQHECVPSSVGNGGDKRNRWALGNQIGECRTQFGKIGSINAVCEATSI